MIAAEDRAVKAVVEQALASARVTTNLVDLEAQDPRVAELYHAARRLQKALTLVDVGLSTQGEEVVAAS